MSWGYRWNVSGRPTSSRTWCWSVQRREREARHRAAGLGRRARAAAPAAGPGRPGRHGRDAARPRSDVGGSTAAITNRRSAPRDRSHHIATGLEYLPAVARRLLHGRDLGEPFDFLTWFEYAPADAGAFEELVGRLRETEEWRYAKREVDVRLARD